ncbi:helix-turn-helix domain-containing protein [Quadrisphaera oryzae]|uniref:helix-turn-helix domain-containing protein n=1 Tax=Quadrisphaera TaxID=317661 RepID=UPI0016455E34|nr:helix-turn-helix domain-containing protein [Quadrisphaera sp. RL12-1S]
MESVTRWATEWADINEASAITGVPVATLRSWRWRRLGEGPESFTVGRRIRYRRDAIEAWMRQQEAAGTSAGAA